MVVFGPAFQGLESRIDHGLFVAERRLNLAQPFKAGITQVQPSSRQRRLKCSTIAQASTFLQTFSSTLKQGILCFLVNAMDSLKL